MPVALLPMRVALLSLLLSLQGVPGLLIDPSVDCFVSTAAGQGSAGYLDAVGTTARLFSPRFIAMGPSDIAYVSDRTNNRIRGLLPNGTVFTLGGNGTTGVFSDGEASASTFFNSVGIAASPFSVVYVADFAFNRLRAISTATRVTSTLVGNGIGQSLDGVGTSALTRLPTGMAMSANSTQLFFTDNVNSAAVLRAVHLASGRVTTLGRGLQLTNGGGGCSGGIAQLRNLSVLVADTGNHRIAQLLSNGSFVTYAGVLGVPGHGDGPRENVTFNFPTDVKVDSDGSLLVLEHGEQCTEAGAPGWLSCHPGWGQPSRLCGLGLWRGSHIQQPLWGGGSSQHPWSVPDL